MSSSGAYVFLVRVFFNNSNDTRHPSKCPSPDLSGSGKAQCGITGQNRVVEIADLECPVIRHEYIHLKKRNQFACVAYTGSTSNTYSLEITVYLKFIDRSVASQIAFKTIDPPSQHCEGKIHLKLTGHTVGKLEGTVDRRQRETYQLVSLNLRVRIDILCKVSPLHPG